MKKLLKVLFLPAMMFAVLLSFSACNSSKNNDTVQPTASAEEDAKLAKLEQQVVDLQKELDGVKKLQPSLTDKAEELKKDDVIKPVEKYTGANYITLDQPKDDADISEEPVVFTGAVSPNTKKIVVVASGGNVCPENPDGPCTNVPLYKDTYTLLNFKFGDGKFTYKSSKKLANLADGSNDYSFTAYFEDNSTKSIKVTIFYNQGGAEMGKPVIYLYPEKKTEVSVNVRPTNGISISEPKIGDGWKVMASPDGELVNIADGKIYPYLFWEGFAANFRTPKEGFVIAAKDVSKFFDTKLKMLGLNAKEIADFKEFWVPRLNEKTYYFITFVPQTDFEKYAPLTVSPKPDSVIRVFFDYRGLDKKISVKEQKLNTAERKGFAVVEWGGRLYR